jgi:hypothetical protein
VRQQRKNEKRDLFDEHCRGAIKEWSKIIAHFRVQKDTRCQDCMVLCCVVCMCACEVTVLRSNDNKSLSFLSFGLKIYFFCVYLCNEAFIFFVCKCVGMGVVNRKFELCSRFARHSALPNTENCWMLQNPRSRLGTRHLLSLDIHQTPPSSIYRFFSMDMSCEMETKYKHLYLRRVLQRIGQSDERHGVHSFGESHRVV